MIREAPLTRRPAIVRIPIRGRLIGQLGARVTRARPTAGRTPLKFEAPDSGAWCPSARYPAGQVHPRG